VLKATSKVGDLDTAQLALK